jgi:hypothetical protein
MCGEEDREHCQLKQQDRGKTLFVIVLVIPKPEENVTAQECNRAQTTPPLEQDQRTQVDRYDVSEE